jgi:hypothetical protein
MTTIFVQAENQSGERRILDHRKVTGTLTDAELDVLRDMMEREYCNELLPGESIELGKLGKARGFFL